MDLTGKVKDWSKLTKEQRLELIEIADSLFIPPNFVQDMYESGELEYDSDN